MSADNTEDHQIEDEQILDDQESSEEKDIEEKLEEEPEQDDDEEEFEWNEVELSDSEQPMKKLIDERFSKELESDKEEKEDEQEEDEQDEQDEQEEEDNLDDLDDETFKEEIQIKQGQADNVFENLKPLTDEEIKAFNDKVNKTGVLYISRVPPYMRPQKIRHLLSPFGTIGRIYLVREDASIHRRRVKSGGNKKILYTEGWVEFMDKKEAKRCASLLNGNIIGGKKSGFYHDDLWTLKYLKGFKWHHLTEKLAYEKRIKMDKLKAEFNQARKADELYLDAVEKSKLIKRAEKIKAMKRNAGELEEEEEEKEETKKPYRMIKQKESVLEE